MKDANLIIGAANTGKTRGVLFKETSKMIENNENIFIVDSREEYYETFGKKLKEKGYNTLVINFNDTTKSNGYNPLLLPYKLYKENKKDDAITMIKDFSFEICKEETQGDPFWTNSAADYLTGLTLILFKEAKEDEINLGSLVMLVNQCEMRYQDDKTYLNKYLENIDLLSPIYIALSGTAFAPYETRASILSVLKQKLNAIVMRENLLDMLCTNDIDLTDINDKTAIFIIGKNEIVNTIINQLYYVTKNNKQSFNLIIEEISNYKNNAYLKDVIQNASYNNIKVFVSARSLKELEKLYNSNISEEFENVINVESEQDLMELGSYKEYPKLKDNKKEYFNFKEYIEKQ